MAFKLVKWLLCVCISHLCPIQLPMIIEAASQQQPSCSGESGRACLRLSAAGHGRQPASIFNVQQNKLCLCLLLC